MNEVERSLVIADYIDRWEPPRAPRCSGCANARVFGEPSWPQVRCAADEELPVVELARLIRPKMPMGWRSAVTCPHYERSGD